QPAHDFVGHGLSVKPRVFDDAANTMVAQGALFDDADWTKCDVGIGAAGIAARPGWRRPVEIATRIGTGHHAVAAADAAIPDLADDAVVRALGSADGTNLHAFGTVAMHARDGKWFPAKLGHCRAFSVGNEDLHPMNGPREHSFLGAQGRHVVLGGTGHHARLATRT